MGTNFINDKRKTIIAGFDRFCAENRLSEAGLIVIEKDTIILYSPDSPEEQLVSILLENIGEKLAKVFKEKIDSGEVTFEIINRDRIH